MSLQPNDRPVIGGNPPQFVAYGEGLSFSRTVGTMASSITKVALVRPGSTTHSVNMAQQYDPVAFTDGSTLTVDPTDMPNARLAPPGYYMLFLVNNLGRPSVAPFVNLWGNIESSINVAAGQTCGAPAISFDVWWDATIPTDGIDRVEAYAPGLICGVDAPTEFKEQAAPAGFNHAVSNINVNTCTTGAWTIRVQSRKGASTSTICKTVNVTCISCPPPCHPPCEIE